MVCGVLFLGRRRRQVLADLPWRRPFTREDATRLACRTYLGKIISLAQKFAAFDVTSKLSALERVNSAALVIDATGRATQMNLPAQNLLGEDFNLVRGRPAAHDPASNRRLQHLVSSALHTAPGGARAYAPSRNNRNRQRNHGHDRTPPCGGKHESRHCGNPSLVKPPPKRFSA